MSEKIRRFAGESILEPGMIMTVGELLNHPTKEGVLFDLRWDSPSTDGTSFWKIENGKAAYGVRWRMGSETIEAYQMMKEGMAWQIRIVATKEVDKSKQWTDEVTKKLKEREPKTGYWSPEED